MGPDIETHTVEGSAKGGKVSQEAREPHNQVFPEINPSPRLFDSVTNIPSFASSSLSWGSCQLQQKDS